MALSATLLATSTFAVGPNLIVNGGFESGFTGWFGTFGYYDTPNALGGARVGTLTDITHSSVGQTLYQNVATVPGWTYEIKFALRLPEFMPGTTIPVLGDSRGGSTTISLRVNEISIASIPVVNRTSWNLYDYDFVATQSSTKINFFNPSSLAWPYIDEISLTVIPEPHTAALLGLASIWFWRGRRSKSGASSN